MSFASFIVRRVTGSLKFGPRLAKPKDRSHEGDKLRDTNIVDLRDPRFTRDQFEKLMTKSKGAEHPAGQIAGDPRFRR